MIEESVNLHGWENCVRLVASDLELLVTTDVGPRIVHLGIPGKPDNLFYVDETQVGRSGGDHWKLYGGHRLWVAPHVREITEAPDNDKIETSHDGESLRLLQRASRERGIGKEIVISLPPANGPITVSHRLFNDSSKPIRVAPWAISVMSPGGTAMMPLSTSDMPDGILPNRSVVYWPFSRVTDSRFQVSERCISVRHDPADSGIGKIGTNADAGWIAYLWHRYIFIKLFDHLTGADYADRGASMQVFVCADYLEMETLGPLVSLAPGEGVSHVERWHLIDNVHATREDELLELIGSTLRS